MIETKNHLVGSMQVLDRSKVYMHTAYYMAWGPQIFTS